MHPPGVARVVGSVRLTADDNLVSLATSLELLRTLVDVGCPRFVGVGTCFGPDPVLVATSETALCGRRTSTASASVNVSVVAFTPISNMSVASARVFLVYGPSDDERRLVPSLGRVMIRGETARSP